MKLYKCSNCGKQVIPEVFRKMGMNPNVNPKRFCCCKTPNITESIAQYEKDVKAIAQAIKDSMPTKEETLKWIKKQKSSYKERRKSNEV